MSTARENNTAAHVALKEVGRVLNIRKDIVTIKGIPSCIYGEMLEFSSGDKGMVIEFDEDKVVTLLIGKGVNIKPGDEAVSTSDMFEIPTGNGIIGRIVNSLAQPIDGKGPIESSERGLVFREAPPIMARVPVKDTLRTGIKILDSMIPIGRGQRELIIGDRQTGKTSVAIDSILNQKNENMICIYCWVGGSYNAMLKVIETLEAKDAMEYTIFVAAPASASSTEQYLAPYTACAIGEYFMLKDRDVLVVFDNLTKHAWIYREISLLLDRSPGREAYPGDIFYIHSQLMERAGKLKPELGGSMTFLPIVDTLQGDVTGYIQTNLISITDGQIYMNSALFNEGFKPAIDVGLSVSRIGSKVQSPALKELCAKLRIEYAQFREFQKLTRLRAKVSDEIAAKISRGQTLTEILIQAANDPVSEIEEILIFYAFNKGVLDRLRGEDVLKFQKEILAFMREYDAGLVKELEENKTLTETIKKGLDRGIVEYFNRCESV